MYLLHNYSKNYIVTVHSILSNVAKIYSAKIIDGNIRRLYYMDN